MRRLFLAIAATVPFALMMATPASAIAIVVSRTSVPIGGMVIVSGDTIQGANKCASGDQVTLISNAFAGHSEFAGVGAVFTPVDSTGHFTVAVTIKSGVTPGTYTIGGRCGGGNFGVNATVTVTGLPRTGASTARDAELALGLLVAGAAAVAFGSAGLGRRRQRIFD
jgi:hypothetical protein